MCHDPKYNCQKQITLAQKQFQLEGKGLENTMKIFKETEKMWNNFIKPGLKIATPNISAGIAAKTNNPQSAQSPSKNLKSLTGGKILSLTDTYGHGVRLEVIKELYDYELVKKRYKC